MPKDIFSFAEHQKKATYSLNYKLTLTRDKVDVVLNDDEAIADARIKIENFHWYVPDLIPSLLQQGILFKLIFSKLWFFERSVFMKKVNNQNPWTFEIGSQENLNVPKWIITGFQQRDRQDSQNLKKDTFYRLTVTSVQCIVETDENPDTSILKKIMMMTIIVRVMD